MPTDEFARIKGAVRTEWLKGGASQPVSPLVSDPVPRSARSARSGEWLLAAGLLLAMVGAGVVWFTLYAPTGDRSLAPPPVVSEPLPFAYLELVRGTVQIGDRVGEEGEELPLRVVLSTPVAGPSEPSGVTIRLSSGHSLRLDSDSAIRLSDEGIVHLDRGRIYIDSGSEAGSTLPASPVKVVTPYGRVTEVGTQFEVRVDPAAEAQFRVRVRSGTVLLASSELSHSVESAKIDSGRELALGAGRPPRWRTLTAHGPEWDRWVALAPGLELDPGPVVTVLDWFCRERGLDLQFHSSEARRLAEETQITWFAAQRPDELELAGTLDPAVPELEFEMTEGRLDVRRVAP